MSTPAPASQQPSIQVYDKYGREFQLTREQWRSEILPATLKSHWDEPDGLYGGILQALNDDFIDEVASAAERLHELEPGTARSVTALAYVKLRKGELDAAQALLDGYLAKSGAESTVLNNLAKVHAARNDHDQVERALWRSLEADPNNDNSVGWFAALHRERGGPETSAQALERIAALPGAWRARIHLARLALDARELARAMTLYREALAMAGGAIPAEALMNITGDLGKRGFLAQILELGVPSFVPEQHGMLVGNNIVKAYLDSGRLAEARATVERMYAYNRPDWKSALTFWEGRIHEAETSRTVPAGSTIEMTMYVIEGPVWSHARSPVAKIFPHAPETAPRVVFLGSTADVPSAPAMPQVQLSDAGGRLSRILPLYLAEQAQFHGGVRVRSLFPWMVNAMGGSFVLTTVPPSDAEAVARALGGGPCDFVVVTHVKTRQEPWSATMRLLRVSDGRCVFQHESLGTPDRPDVIAAGLAIEIQRALAEHAGTKGPSPAEYLPPAPPYLGRYLLRLEQLLAIRCATSPAALHGVREILDGCMELAIDFPKSAVMRALLADVVARLRNIRPDVIDQYRDRLKLLASEHPLDEPAHAALDGMLEAAVDGQFVPG